MFINHLCESGVAYQGSGPKIKMVPPKVESVKLHCELTEAEAPGGAFVLAFFQPVSHIPRDPQVVL